MVWDGRCTPRIGLASWGCLIAVVIVAAGLALPAGALAWTCSTSDPAPTGADAFVQASGEDGTLLGESIALTLGHPKGVIDPTSIGFDIVHQEDGATEHVQADTYGSGTFVPRRLGTYLISGTFWSWGCPGGPGTESQRQGPFTTAQITRNVIEGDPPAPLYVWRLLSRRETGSGYRFPFGSAEFLSSVNCRPDGLGSQQPINTIMRYTTDGRAPTLRSPRLRVTAEHGCADNKRPAERARRGAWGRVYVSNAGGSQAAVFATPGHVVRVWLAFRWEGHVISAIRARSRERNGHQSWVRDKGPCPGAPSGCARLHKFRPPRT